MNFWQSIQPFVILLAGGALAILGPRVILAAYYWLQKKEQPNPNDLFASDLALELRSLRGVIDDLNVGFQKAVREIVVPHPIALGDSAMERLTEIVIMLASVKEAVSNIRHDSPPFDEIMETLRGWESRSIERHKSVLIRMDATNNALAGFGQLASLFDGTLDKAQQKMKESLDQAEKVSQARHAETCSGLVGINDRLDKIAGLLAQHLTAQKALARTIEGKEGDENQELSERVLALLAERPEMTFEEALARVRRAQVYSPR